MTIKNSGIQATPGEPRVLTIAGGIFDAPVVFTEQEGLWFRDGKPSSAEDLLQAVNDWLVLVPVH